MIKTENLKRQKQKQKQKQKKKFSTSWFIHDNKFLHAAPNRRQWTQNELKLICVHDLPTTLKVTKK